MSKFHLRRWSSHHTSQFHQEPDPPRLSLRLSIRQPRALHESYCKAHTRMMKAVCLYRQDLPCLHIEEILTSWDIRSARNQQFLGLCKYLLIIRKILNLLTPCLELAPVQHQSYKFHVTNLHRPWLSPMGTENNQRLIHFPFVRWQQFYRQKTSIVVKSISKHAVSRPSIRKYSFLKSLDFGLVVKLFIAHKALSEI